MNKSWDEPKRSWELTNKSWETLYMYLKTKTSYITLEPNQQWSNYLCEIYVIYYVLFKSH